MNTYRIDTTNQIIKTKRQCEYAVVQVKPDGTVYVMSTHKNFELAEKEWDRIDLLVRYNKVTLKYQHQIYYLVQVD